VVRNSSSLPSIQILKKYGKERKKTSAVELHLSGLIGTASHPGMQKIRRIGLFFENRL
jgi:hypothetical protein